MSPGGNDNTEARLVAATKTVEMDVDGDAVTDFQIVFANYGSGLNSLTAADFLFT